MSSAEPLQVIFLDIDDTLFGTTGFVQGARRAAVEAMIARGLQCEPEQALAALAEVVAEFGSNDDHHYDRLMQRLPPTATAEVNHDLLVVAGVIAYHNEKWEHLRLHEQAEVLLRELAATDLRLGIISAGLRRKQMEKILRLGVDRFLDPALLFITDAVGIAKSNPLLYRRCAEATGSPLGSVMHVGDHPYSDIDPANAAGLQTVWVRQGKHAVNQPKTEPTHTVDDLAGLHALLRDVYGLPLS